MTVGSARGRREASGARSEIPTFRFRRFFASFGTPDFRRNRPESQDFLILGTLFSTFLRFLRSGAFRKGPGTDFRPPGPDFGRIFQILRLVPPGSCRSSPGSAGMVLRLAPGVIPESPGTLPDQNPVEFSDQISVDFVTLFCRCRVPPDCRRDAPPTSVTHSAGFPLGYGDLAQRFKFAVPLRGAGVV